MLGLNHERDSVSSVLFPTDFWGVSHLVAIDEPHLYILALTESSNALVERVTYKTYGKPTLTNAAGTTLSVIAKATRYSFTGREWDPSLELHHFRAR